MRQFALCLGVVIATSGPVLGQEAVAKAPPAPTAAESMQTSVLTPAEQEDFLRKARLGKIKGASTGVTGTQRATMRSATLVHDASIQTIDQRVARFETSKGTELDFRDFWGYNIAAYRLGVMLGLDMIPPSVYRRYRAKEAAFTWWIDDVIMDEHARTEKKISPPDSTYWVAQNDIARVFDELIANIDRNQGNILIDKQWKVWLIDHSRAFRTTETLRAPQSVRRCEQRLFDKLKTLTPASLKEQLDDYLTQYEIAAILKRRDRLVAHIEQLGPGALYELQRP